MGDLTKNFSRHEFACKCGCGFDTVDFELLNVLQNLANHLSFIHDCKIMVIIVSGCRCKEYNEKVKKRYNSNYKPYSSKSQHMFARAADIKVYKKINNEKSEKFDPNSIYSYLNTKYPNQYGIGRYKTFTHIDTKSGKPRRW